MTDLHSIEAIVIGGSAGAVAALSEILPNLTRSYPLPIMIVIHLPPDKDSTIAELFHMKCPLQVKEAEDKEIIQAGTIYFAPPDYHLLIEPDFKLSFSTEEPVLFSRPSIDVLFETAAVAYGNGALGIILTGANEDGAAGLKAIAKAGGMAIAQAPGTAQMPTMPEAAIKASPAARVLTLSEISNYLIQLGEA